MRDCRRAEQAVGRGRGAGSDVEHVALPVAHAQQARAAPARLGRVEHGEQRQDLELHGAEADLARELEAGAEDVARPVVALLQDREQPQRVHAVARVLPVAQPHGKRDGFLEPLLRSLVVALLHEHVAEVGERCDEPAAEAQGAPERDAVHVVACGGLEVPQPERRVAREVEGAGLDARVAESARVHARFVGDAQRAPVVALDGDEHAQADRRVHASGGDLVAAGQRRLERRDALGRGPAAAPERHERADQAQLRRVRARAVQECDGGREIGALGLELEEAHGGLVQRDGRLGELREVVGVPLPAGALLVRRARELVGRELPDRLAHAEATGAVRLCASRHEMLLDEGLERVGSRLADRFCAVPRGVAGEDGEAAEEPPLALVEQVRRPLRGRAQRALTGVRSRAAVEQVEPLAQARQQLCRREDGRARGRELERQRQAVEAPAELGHLGRRHEGGVHAARPRDVERDGVLLAERRHRIGGLAAQPEAFAARHQQRRAVDRAQLFDRAGGRSQHVLGVVDEQQDAPVAQPLRERARPGGRIRRDGARDLPGDLRRVAHRGEGHEVHAVGERVRRLGGSLEREVRLADAAGPGQREQAGAVSQRRNHRRELGMPSHERRGRQREAGVLRHGRAGRPAVGADRAEVVLLEHLALERAQRGGGLDAEPLDEGAARLAIGLQRLGLPAVPVEREHQRAVQALSQRVLADQPAQLTDHLGVAPAGQVRVDALGDAVQAELLEARDLGLRERLAPHVGQGRAAPERERLAQRRRRLLGPSARQLDAALREQVGEAAGVERAGRQVHRVAAARARRSRRVRVPCARARPRPGRRSAGAPAGPRPTRAPRRCGRRARARRRARAAARAARAGARAARWACRRGGPRRARGSRTRPSARPQRPRLIPRLAPAR